uniref:NAC domain-containing protein n=1 Tax=Oryza brachyantha TaxID=4533 RepID=J3L548_ORYBR
MFSPRSRKYTYGKRPSRSTSHVGFWKSTSKNEPVLETQDDGTTKVIGYKGCLTYHELDEKNATMAVKPTAGRELKKLSKKDIAIKTPWKMWEFVCSNSNRPCDVGEDPMRLNDWVLCKVTNKEMCQGASKKTQPVNKKQKLRGVVIKQPLESSWASSSQDTVVQQETPNSSLVVAGGDAAAAVTAVPTPLQMVPPYRSSLHYNTNDSLVIAGGDAAAAEDPLVLQTVPPYAPSLHYNTNGFLVVSGGDASVVKDRMPLQMVSLYAPSLHHNTNGSLVVVRAPPAVAAMAEDPMPLQMVSPYAPSLHYNTNGFVVDYSTEVAQNSIVVDYNIGVDASYITSDSPVTTANGFVDLQNDSLNYQ